jgi:hypothetical protein
VCVDEAPPGSSVNNALMQVHDIAQNFQTARVVEWDGDMLDIADPYFLFYLRCSPRLGKMG